MPRCRGGKNSGVGNQYCVGGRGISRTRGSRGRGRGGLSNMKNNSRKNYHTSNGREQTTEPRQSTSSTEPQPSTSSTEPQPSTSSTEPQPLTSSTEFQPLNSSTENLTLSSQLRLIRQKRTIDKKRTATLKYEDKKRLFEMKRHKEVNFMIMPDAPAPKKRKTHLSPVRVPCALVPGTPTVPPERVLQPWMKTSTRNTQQQTHITPTVTAPTVSTLSIDSVPLTITTYSIPTVTIPTISTSSIDLTTTSNTTQIVPVISTISSESIPYSQELVIVEEVEIQLVDKTLPGSSCTGAAECDTEEADDLDILQAGLEIHSRQEDIIIPAKLPDDAAPAHVNHLLRIDTQNNVQMLPPDIEDKTNKTENVITPYTGVAECDTEEVDGLGIKAGVAILRQEIPAKSPDNADPAHVNPLLRFDIQNEAQNREMLPSDTKDTTNNTDNIIPSGAAECDPESNVLNDWLGKVTENPGSDIEIDDIEMEPGIAINSQRVNIFPAQFPDDTDQDHVNHLLRIDAQNDALIQQMLPPDAVVFDWKKEISVFTGVQEQFTEISGPTFPISELSNPLQALQKIWDDVLIAKIVDETNKYARSFPNSNKFWKDVTSSELWCFLGILIIQGLDPKPVEREFWYSNLPYTNMPLFRKIMPYKRFVMLKRFLHFSDNQEVDPNISADAKKLCKIHPIIEHLCEKFRTLYRPDQQISLDESLLLWKGRLNFSQKIANKAARVGIKSYEICESKSGYLWNFKIYTGKSTNDDDATGHTNETDENTPDGATANIVYDLTRPLFNKGHTLIMDNFYNSPLLSRSLKLLHKTDTMGTLRLNREFVPDTLKRLKKSEMRIGEIAFSQTNDLTVLVFRDANLVSMISTYHQVEVGGKEKHGQYKYRPKVILDYNLAMGGVDKKDQLLSAFPMERSRNSIWYKKLFRRLFNVSIMNANIFFNCGTSKLRPRQFREELVKNIISQYRGPMPHQIPQVIEVISSNDSSHGASRPHLIGGHYPERGDSSRARCKWCAQKKNLTRTTWRCDVCKVALCIEYCFRQYHT